MKLDGPFESPPVMPTPATWQRSMRGRSLGLRAMFDPVGFESFWMGLFLIVVVFLVEFFGIMDIG